VIRAFFDYFKTVAKKGRWELNRYSRIRHKSSGVCPLAFAANQRCHNGKLDSGDWGIAARRFSLPIHAALDIVNAADYAAPTRSGRAQLYRQRLLSITGLA
jgi:hypothetical protein